MSFKRRDFKRNSEKKDANLIVIATEGVKTEVDYFKGLISKDAFYSSKVKVHVLEREEAGKSAPNHVIEELDSFAETYQIEEDDELWMVIDVDRWGNAKLGEIASKCNQKKYELAVSNPCFEVWLVLHFFELNNEEPGLMTANNLEEKLKEHLTSFNKTKLKFSDFKEYTQKAINNSKKLDRQKTSRWIEPIGTRVYELVEKIINYSN